MDLRRNRSNPFFLTSFPPSPSLLLLSPCFSLLGSTKMGEISMKVKETAAQMKEGEGEGEDRSIPNLSFTFDAAEFLTGLSKVSNERARPQRHYRVVSGRSSLLKDSRQCLDCKFNDSGVSTGLNGRSNAKWIQTAANRVAGAPYESACWKLAPRRH